LKPKLATCLGVENYVEGQTFDEHPEGFKDLFGLVLTLFDQNIPTLSLLFAGTPDNCFGQSGKALDVEDPSTPVLERL
jgi:hypothetical protein